ncbi:Aromatic acid exporter family member 1 [Priestia megaterium]|nr:Aromatic acid exporter family member 1 [Priestia megaterium]
MTALICQSIGWPYMLAVITAIVTIEPTAADSIKKAFIRFPASAIGAAFAMLYTFLLGVTPLTYMLVAVSTIISCSKLRLHAGTLVATLTGVAIWKFHHFTRTAMRKFHYEYKKLSLMRQLVYHIGNLIYLPAHQLQSARYQVIWDTFTSFHNVLQNEQYKSSLQHQTLVLTLKQRFWAHKQEENRGDHPFSTETTMLYELLAIHHLLEELHRIHCLKDRYNLNNSSVSVSS